jgi:pheromone shutdown protein TraB
LGLRSAVMRVKHRETPMQFLVFPMTHMAQADFYREVTRMLRGTDMIVAEGIKGRSALGSTLTATYRVLARRPGINLVHQSIDYGKLGKPVIYPDVTSVEFATAWRKAPLRQRVMMWMMMAVYIPSQLLISKKRLFKRVIGEEINDLASPRDEEMADAMPEIDDAMLGERDRRLIDALVAVHEAHKNDDITIGIVYGAAHVPAIVTGLESRLGYFVRRADWVTIIDL